ncbi:hypothetical protein Tsubulata_045446 [Turnera subulata]|uniref:Uncharacterized protein n=1 Tax=Turnera subulata TaxID=218843 RepID=A0A9Q0JCY5_9ROSI|nr:hypothetical protein Tsubulata_045446 [Turnera subulata]
MRRRIGDRKSPERSERREVRVVEIREVVISVSTDSDIDSSFGLHAVDSHIDSFHDYHELELNSVKNKEEVDDIQGSINEFNPTDHHLGSFYEDHDFDLQPSMSFDVVGSSGVPIKHLNTKDDHSSNENQNTCQRRCSTPSNLVSH